MTTHFIIPRVPPPTRLAARFGVLIRSTGRVRPGGPPVAPKVATHAMPALAGGERP